MVEAKDRIEPRMTAEHAYQEDCLAEEYDRSGNPDFQKRAEVMRRTWERQSQPDQASENQTVTLFQA